MSSLTEILCGSSNERDVSKSFPHASSPLSSSEFHTFLARLKHRSNSLKTHTKSSISKHQQLLSSFPEQVLHSSNQSLSITEEFHLLLSSLHTSLESSSTDVTNFVSTSSTHAGKSDPVNLFHSIEKLKFDASQITKLDNEISKKQNCIDVLQSIVDVYETLDDVNHLLKLGNVLEASQEVSNLRFIFTQNFNFDEFKTIDLNSMKLKKMDDYNDNDNDNDDDDEKITILGNKKYANVVYFLWNKFVSIDLKIKNLLNILFQNSFHFDKKNNSIQIHSYLSLNNDETEKDKVENDKTEKDIIINENLKKMISISGLFLSMEIMGILEDQICRFSDFVFSEILNQNFQNFKIFFNIIERKNSENLKKKNSNFDTFSIWILELKKEKLENINETIMISEIYSNLLSIFEFFFIHFFEKNGKLIQIFGKYVYNRLSDMIINLYLNECIPNSISEFNIFKTISKSTFDFEKKLFEFDFLPNSRVGKITKSQTNQKSQTQSNPPNRTDRIDQRDQNGQSNQINQTRHIGQTGQSNQTNCTDEIHLGDQNSQTDANQKSQTIRMSQTIQKSQGSQSVEVVGDNPPVEFGGFFDGFFGGRLTEFVSNVENHFSKKRKKCLLNLVRNLIVNSNYDTVQVGDLETTQFLENENKKKLDQKFFGLEKFLVSEMTKKIIDIIHDTMKETIESPKHISKNYFFICRDLLLLFYAIYPTLHGERINQILYLSILFQNDCFYIYHHCLLLSLQYRRYFFTKFDENITFMDIACKFLKTSEETHAKIMKNQINYILESLDFSKIILNLSNEEYGNCERAIKRTLHLIGQIFDTCQKAMNHKQFIQTFSYIIQNIFDNIFLIIFSLNDLSVEETENLRKLLLSFTDKILSFIFSFINEEENKMNNIYKIIPNFKKMNRLIDIFDMSLVAISQSWKNNDLIICGFTPEEVEKLIRIIFSDSRNRREVLSQLNT